MPITAKTKLNDNVSISKFLGTEDPTNLNFLREDKAKKQLAKYLYVHSTILQTVYDNREELKGVSLQVAEGVYRPGPSETITPKSLNDFKLKGKTVVYKAVNSRGEEDNSKLFDVAAFLKDNAYYEEMILAYDSFKGTNNITARLIITLPDIDDDWNGVFNRKLSTEYNNTKLASGELVEVLPFDVSTSTAGSQGSINLDAAGLVTLRTQSGLEYTVAAVFAAYFEAFVAELEYTGYKIKKIYGYSQRSARNTTRASFHSMGAAIDINAYVPNGYLAGGPPRGWNPRSTRGGEFQCDLPLNISDIAAKYGLGWGGNWNKPWDPMHFSAASAERGGFKMRRRFGVATSDDIIEQVPVRGAGNFYYSGVNRV